MNKIRQKKPLKIKTYSMLYAISRTLIVLSLYIEKSFIYFSILIISLLLCLPTFPVLSSFLSLSLALLTLAYSVTVMLASSSPSRHFLVSFSNKVLDSCFIFFFLEIRSDGFRYILESFSIMGL